MIAPSAVTVSLALVMGLRHALDADHLAAVDGLTRWHSARSSRLAVWCGALFATGHCVVILTASLVLGRISSSWTAPGWLSPAAAFVAAATLVVISLANLRLLRHEPSAGDGVRSRLYTNLLRAPAARQVLLDGALFAISFDTLGITLLFSAARAGGSDWESSMPAWGLASSFCAGMLVVSAANGWWIAHLLKQSSVTGVQAMRIMTRTVSCAGLVVGTSVMLRLFCPPLDRWLGAHDYAASLFVVAALLTGYALALHSGRAASYRHVPTAH